MPVPRYNNATEGNPSDGTARGNNYGPYMEMTKGVNKIFALPRNGVDLGATANNDNVVISAPSGNDDWITLFYARAHDSGETLPTPISADIVIAIKDGTYPASDLTTINITNITSI